MPGSGAPVRHVWGAASREIPPAHPNHNLDGFRVLLKTLRSGCGTSSPPPLNSHVPCDSAMTKSPHRQYSYACPKGLAPPMGSGCGTSSPPPMNSRVPCDSAMAKSPHRLSQTVGATRGFVPQSPDAAQAIHAFRAIQPWQNPCIASTHTLVSKGWRHPWVCAAVSGRGMSSPPPSVRLSLWARQGSAP